MFSREDEVVDFPRAPLKGLLEFLVDVRGLGVPSDNGVVDVETTEGNNLISLFGV